MRDISERRKIEQLQQLAARLIEVRDRERKQIARELHENIAQYIAGIRMFISASVRDPTKARNNVESQRLLDEGHALLQQCRTTARTLHPSVLDNLGLAPAVHWYVRDYAELHGIEVSLDIEHDLPRLPVAHELALFRIMEEALTNVCAHSGAKAAEVRLSCDTAEIRLEVTDAGRGMTLPDGRASGHGPKGTGILEMGERMRSLGGKLEIASGGDGTTVSGVLPFVPRQTEPPLCSG